MKTFHDKASHPRKTALNLLINIPLVNQWSIRQSSLGKRIEDELSIELFCL